jgi:hypothetical protein
MQLFGDRDEVTQMPKLHAGTLVQYLLSIKQCSAIYWTSNRSVSTYPFPVLLPEP